MRSFISIAAVLGFVLAVPSPAMAQGVFKCSAGGKTVYQSTPCAGQGRALEIAPGPDEQQVLEAKARADRQKSQSGAPQAARLQESTDRHLMDRKVDCAKLNKDRADAFGRRNGLIRSSRSSGLNEASGVDKEHDEIRRIESQMVRGGCKPT